jgi:16S rRNA (guanine(966)-N(2))-methyltransferase RsmD
MNIIAGKARGRKLKTLPGEATRPTQGKVRAALFSTLMAWIPDAAWLDLYAGSGAVGLEAVSRGARRAVLVEVAAPAVAIVRENIALTKLEGLEVLALDAMAAIARLKGQRFDVVFMDPPYADDPVPLAEAVEAANLLGDSGRLVIEHRRDRPMPEAIGGLARLKTNNYAETALSFYAWGAPAVEIIG